MFVFWNESFSERKRKEKGKVIQILLGEICERKSARGNLREEICFFTFSLLSLEHPVLLHPSLSDISSFWSPPGPFPPHLNHDH